MSAKSQTIFENAFLQKYVNREGKVNHQAIQRNPGQLEKLLEQIAVFDVAKATMADQYAFYLNACNVLVIGQIVAHYPLTSVQDMPGFSTARSCTSPASS